MFKSNKLISDRIQILISIIILTVLVIIIALYTNNIESMGDDVLFASENGIKYYLDGVDYTPGMKLTSIFQVFKELAYTYRYWSGRILGYFFAYGGWILPRILRAFITSIILVFNSLMVVKISRRITYSETLKYVPLIIIALFSLYWWPIGTYYTYMWTFISEYQIPMLLGLLYYDYLFINKGSSKIVNFALGFLLGISHEIITLSFIVLIVLRIIIDRNKENKSRTILKSWPLFIGYIICFFAPGNFYRRGQSHDIVNTSYAERFERCREWHWTILTHSTWSKIIFYTFLAVISILLVILIIKRRRIKICDFLDGACFFIVGLVFIPIWALMPRITLYGLTFWMVGVYIFIFNINNELSVTIEGCKIFKWKFLNVYAALLIAFLVLYYYNEVSDVSTIANNRRIAAHEALEKGWSEVYVDRYPDTLSKERYSLKTLNNQDEYDQPYYITFWGCRLIISK